MPVINGIYTKDFPSLGRDGLGTDLIPVAISGNPITYKTTLSELLATISPALSFGTFGATPNAQGGSYSAGVITLQPASASFPGGVTTSAQGFTGLKTFNTASGTNGLNLNKTSNDVGILGLQVSAVDKSYIEWNVNDGGSGIGTAFNIRNGQGAIGLYDNTNTGLKISGGNAVFAGTVTLADEAYSSSWNGKLESPTKNAIWDAGFLTSASGVVLTTTNQNVGGVKTFTDNLIVSYGATTTASIQATSTNAGGRALSVLGNSTLEPFAVVQNGAGKLAEFSNSGGAKFIIYNGGSFEAQGATIQGSLTATSATINGATTIDAGNGNQLTLDNAGERFTQITTLHNGTQKASQFWDNTNTYYQIGSDVASSTVRVVAQTNGVELANGATSWSAISDFRQKKIIRPIEDALTTMKDFRTVIGRYNTDSATIERSFLIAQDVQKTYPYAVTVGNDEDKTLRLSYTELIPLLVKAIQELEAKVKILESK